MYTVETQVRINYKYLFLTLGGLLAILAFAWFVLTSTEKHTYTFISCMVAIFGYIGWQIYFTRKRTRIVFSFEDLLLIHIYNSRKNSWEKAHEFNYAEIKSFLFDVATKESCSIGINLIDGRKFRWVLCSEKELSTELKKTLAFEIFDQLRKTNPNISPAKPFFATKWGTGLVIVLVISVAINIIAHLIYGMTTQSLISLPTTLGLSVIAFAARSQQLSMYKEIKDAVGQDQTK
ncbi:hypothetical protein C8P68_102522 [Mucilaginibacter yixingensis]|uniref:Uncharacterized protein n=1 Tax=Mucilaginibacter yixingensis TaxID=1295612 RepID=A0A2T5JD60_9SPHI|nr:hypothetical protein [Mucilaginibacter yixingensis]PTQ99694.1 hypothetical protein C8P68_102522 [Mucilaginibacter yixingensis]